MLTFANLSVKLYWFTGSFCHLFVFSLSHLWPSSEKRTSLPMARWNRSDALKSLIYKQLPSYFLTYFVNGEPKIEDTGGHLTFSSVWIIFLCVSFPLRWHFISEKIQSRGLVRLLFKKYLRNAWVQLDNVMYHLMWRAWHPALDISNCWCSNKQHIQWVKPFLSHLKCFSNNFISFFNKKQNHTTRFFYTLNERFEKAWFPP